MYLYVAPDLERAAAFDDSRLAATTERHQITLQPPAQRTLDFTESLTDPSVTGVVFELHAGLPTTAQLRLAERALGSGRRVWLYWPAEEAVECIDAERASSLDRHLRAVRWMTRVGLRLDAWAARWERAPAGLRWVYRGEFPVRRMDILDHLERLNLRAQPVPLEPAAQCGQRRVFRGPGLYIRFDFWNEDEDEQVVRDLASMSERMVSARARFRAVANDQVVLGVPPRSTGQDAIVLAPAHYLPVARALCEALRPAFIFEHASAAQYAGAELSQLLQIPYIVEFDGADAVIRDAVKGAAPAYDDVYRQTCDVVLRQATVVVVRTRELAAELAAQGVDAARIVVVDGEGLAAGIVSAVDALVRARPQRIDTGDAYKDQVQNQWNENPVGSHYVRESQPHTLDWFLEVERHRYGTYAPWMPAVMEFAAHRGQSVLEIGGGVGTDLAQFASNGAAVTDVDLAAGHLRLAEENFRLRGLSGRFIHHDAETLPLPDDSFDVVYSNGVLHHTPNTTAVVKEIGRVLKPGGRAIVMLYAEDSLHYWRKLVWESGVKDGWLDRMSMGEIMSRLVERTANEARPLVKAYTRERAARLFAGFAQVEVLQRQLVADELPDGLKWTLRYAEPRFGWNLIVKADKAR